MTVHRTNFSRNENLYAKVSKSYFKFMNVFNKCGMHDDKSNSKLFLVCLSLKTRKTLAQ